jgi:hypothetical protein
MTLYDKYHILVDDITKVREFSYGCWKCMFVGFLTGYKGPPNHVHYLV